MGITGMDYHAPLDEKAVAKALSTPACRSILVACMKEPPAVRSISEQAGLALASAYRQVHDLVASGLLVVERSAMTHD